MRYRCECCNRIISAKEYEKLNENEFYVSNLAFIIHKTCEIPYFSAVIEETKSLKLVAEQTLTNL